MVRTTDNDAGIPIETLAHAFERLYRVEDARARDIDDGAGVDLVISRANTRIRGDDLTVRSDDPGHDAAFALTLPTVTS